MKARGNTKVILDKVGEIQNLIGEAKSLHDNDVNQMSHELAQQKLMEAHFLCLEITGMCDPV